MTQQEIDALKARFKAGGYPTQQDFEALIDAITNSGGSSSASAPTGPTVIHVNNVLRDKIVSNYETNKGDFPGEYASMGYYNPFTATVVSDIINAYEQLNSVSLEGIDSVIIINESWDFKYNYTYDGSWDATTTGFFNGNLGSYGVENSNVPIYIKTKYANILPSDSIDSSLAGDEAYTAASNNPTEYGASYDSYGGHDAIYEIQVIPDGNAMMFVKRSAYTDNQGNSNTVDWVPVNKNVTITEYELGQMAQEFTSNNTTS
jgi:hypothetical protein